MKRRIIMSLVLLFFVFAVGVAFATFHVRKTTTTLHHLTNVNQIAELRRDLIMSIQTVDSNSSAMHISLGQKLDLIMHTVKNLGSTAQQCSGCHHSPETTKEIVEVQSLIKSYRNDLRHYMTASADGRQIKKVKLGAVATGSRLLVKTEAMFVRARNKLESMTGDALGDMQQAMMILLTSMLLILLIGAIVSVKLTASITRPINDLVHAAGMIATGGPGYTISRQDKTEFGELVSHFNTMSIALQNSHTKLVREVIEHKQTTASLAESEAFLNTIFDSIRDPFCIIDNAYRIVRANEAYAQMKKVDLRHLVGERCYATLHGRSSICDDCIIQRTFRSGGSCAEEKTVQSPEGAAEWREIYTYPITGTDGNISHVVEYTRDITDRKKAEAALRESEERYALATRGANDGLWDWDLKSNEIYFSPRWKSILGYKEEELGRHPEEWLGRIHPDDRVTVEAKITTHLIGQYPHFECEFRILHRDGTHRWVLARGLAVRSKDGKATRIAGSLTDITERKIAEDQLLHNALHDPLTSLPNRALFMDRLDHVIRSSQRYTGYLYAVLFLDLDRFKTINDSFGHIIGDKLLIAVGQKLSHSLRPGDTVARIGGDEFAILLENISHLADAVEVAERIRKELSMPFYLEGHEIFSGASIGIALGSGAYEHPEQALRDADIAMYQAKAKGNSSYEIFDSKMYLGVVEHLELETDLRRAEHKEFVLHYQPIIDLQKHLIAGFEALVRWSHPKRGLIYPTEFIPLAEETGLIVPIGEWTLREACRQLRAWQVEHPQDPPLTMSMNISGRQFYQHKLLGMLADIVSQTGIDPGSLALEITESIIMENMESAAVIMAQLRALGVHIYIDDFGTGYSSLSYLHHFPITALKIDRTFVNKLSANSGNKEVIATIVSLAKSLNLEVIAEGVELSHQLSKINNLNCRYGQGYLFSEPMAPEAVNAWMEAKHPLHKMLEAPGS